MLTLGALSVLLGTWLSRFRAAARHKSNDCVIAETQPVAPPDGEDGRDIGLRSMVQSVALRAYGTWPVQRILATSLGRNLMEYAYFTYKRHVEAPGCEVLAQHLEPGQWAIDVGANIGYFSTMFAGWVSAGGKVLALEPEAANYQRLLIRLSRTPDRASRVVSRQAAACERDGVVHLAVQDNHPGDHRLAQADGGVATPGHRLDTLWAEVGKPHIGLLKIDVQGAEIKVLTGARELIERDHPAIFIEVDHAALTSFGTSPGEVLSFLADAGYVFSILNRTGLHSATSRQIATLVEGPPATYCDVLALPSNRGH